MRQTPILHTDLTFQAHSTLRPPIDPWTLRPFDPSTLQPFNPMQPQTSRPLIHHAIYLQSLNPLIPRTCNPMAAGQATPDEIQRNIQLTDFSRKFLFLAVPAGLTMRCRLFRLLGLSVAS